MSYRCVVCQEEITEKEQSYSLKFYNMALCRKHQEIQKVARSKQAKSGQVGAKTLETKTNSNHAISKSPQTPVQKAPVSTKIDGIAANRYSDAQNYFCVVCNEPITAEEHSYSKAVYNMALCRKHQDIQKQIKAKADLEQKTKPLSDTETAPVVSAKVAEPEVLKKSVPEKVDNTLIEWLIQWAAARPINLAVESKHFFTEGMRLEEFARDVIAKAKDEILVTSPFVDSCFLATALQDARDRRVNVRIISRRPKKDKDDLPKLECHAALRKKGITIHYINTIHSKIIVVDRKIAILSSMNLYSGSTGGGLLEAGIVSFEKKVVDSATKYITDLLEKTESPDITSYSNPRYSYRR